LPSATTSGRVTVTGYRIKYKRSRSTARSESQFVSGPVEQFTLKGLQANTEYELRVVPQYSDAHVGGTSSERLLARTDATPADESRLPDPPAFLTAVAKGTQIAITFAAPTNRSVAVRGFTLNYGIGYPDVFTQLLAADDTQFVINSLDQFSEYIISLKAYNRLGNGIPVYVTAKTGRSEMTAAQQPNEQPDDEADDEEEKEDKEEDDKEEEAEEEHAFDGQAFGTAIIAASSSSASSGSSVGSSSSSSAGNRKHLSSSMHSLPTQHLDAEPPDDQLDVNHAPLPPLALKAHPIGSSRIQLSWAGDTLQYPNRYVVRYAPLSSRSPINSKSLTSGGSANHFRLLNSTQPNLTVERLRPFTAYEFAVRLVLDGVRRSMWSLRATNTTLESLPLGAPRKLTILPLSPTTVSSAALIQPNVGLSSSASAAVAPARMFISSALHSNTIASAVTGSALHGKAFRSRKLIKTARKHSTSSQPPIAAAAISSNLDTFDSDDSNEMTADSIGVDQPKALSAVAISWQQPRQVNGPIVSYSIAFSTNQSASVRDWPSRTVPGDQLQLMLKDLQPDTQYFFRAQVRNNKGFGPFSPMVAFRTNSRKSLPQPLLFLHNWIWSLLQTHKSRALSFSSFSPLHSLNQLELATNSQLSPLNQLFKFAFSFATATFGEPITLINN
jgi:hypothetical protein